MVIGGKIEIFPHLQVLDNLGLVEGLDTSKHPGVGHGLPLLRSRQLVKLTSGEGLCTTNGFFFNIQLQIAGKCMHAYLSVGVLVFVEDADAFADGLGRVLVVAGDHDDPDAGLFAEGDRRLDLHAGRVQHANHAHESQVRLVLDKLGRVLQVHVLKRKEKHIKNEQFLALTRVKKNAKKVVHR